MENEGFPLKGYALPLSPGGTASAVDAPPWHYAGDVMHLTFRTDEKKARKLVPPHFDMHRTPGEGAVWFVEWVSVSESNPDLAFVNPERSIYHECIVMLCCEFEGTPGYFVSYIWVDRDFSLMRGFVQGFPKKLGRIHTTKLHPFLPGVGGKKPGAKVRGICLAHEERVVEGSLHLTRPAEPAEIPPVKFYLMRHFPDYANPGKLLVHDLVANNVENAAIGEVWAGDGEVRFMESPFEEVSGLGPVEVSGGFLFSIGMTITGGRVLHRYL